MKAYFWIPFACLAGVLVGSWGPRAELRELENRQQEEKSRPKNAAAASFKTFAELANIPAEAKRPRHRRPRPPKDGAKTNKVIRLPDPPQVAADASNVSTQSVEKAGRPHHMPVKFDRNLSPEDLRARIEEAQELWQTRVEIARANWKSKLKVTGENGARFDAAMDEMNQHLHEMMQALAQQVAERGKMTAELGLRLVGDATTIMAETYEKVGVCAPAELRDSVADMPMSDFIDPGVAEPLIEVQDLFKNQVGNGAGT